MKIEDAYNRIIEDCEYLLNLKRGLTSKNAKKVNELMELLTWMVRKTDMEKELDRIMKEYSKN